MEHYNLQLNEDEAQCIAKLRASKLIGRKKVWVSFCLMCAGLVVLLLTSNLETLTLHLIIGIILFLSWNLYVFFIFDRKCQKLARRLLDSLKNSES